MAFLEAQNISAHCVAHIGEVEVYTDMSMGKRATGTDIRYANRLHMASRTAGELVCSEALVDVWQDNDYFELHGSLRCNVAEDELEYCWRLARPKNQP